MQVHPPERNVSNNLVVCEPPACSLHFHMSSSDYARLGVFSTESAPGIIIAHGRSKHGEGRERKEGSLW